MTGQYAVCRYPSERIRFDLVAYAHRGRRYLAVVVVESWAGLLDRRIAVYVARDRGPFETRWVRSLPLPAPEAQRFWLLLDLPMHLEELPPTPDRRS